MKDNKYRISGNRVVDIQDSYKGRDPKCPIHGNLSPFWKNRKAKGYIDV